MRGQLLQAGSRVHNVIEASPMSHGDHLTAPSDAGTNRFGGAYVGDVAKPGNVRLKFLKVLSDGLLDGSHNRVPHKEDLLNGGAVGATVVIFRA